MFRFNNRRRFFYFKKYIKRKTRELHTKNIIKFYKRFILRFSGVTAPLDTIYNTFMLFTHPRRQQHLTFGSFSQQKVLSLSTGQIVVQYGNFGKFFKRSPGSLPGLALQLKKTKAPYLQRLYLVTLKNLNKKQYSLYERIFSLSPYRILYLIHKKSFAPRFERRHRIARSVLRLLLKQAD